MSMIRREGSKDNVGRERWYYLEMGKDGNLIRGE